MIQRKQTLFLLIALILTVCCLCMPLGGYNHGLGLEGTVYNLWITDTNGTHDFSVWALFAILLITCPINIAAIFSYHNRMVQSRFCVFNTLLIIGWYIVFTVFILGMKKDSGSVYFTVASIFPLVSLILYFMARKAILADERLVRAADRIR